MTELTETRGCAAPGRRAALTMLAAGLGGFLACLLAANQLLSVIDGERAAQTARIEIVSSAPRGSTGINEHEVHHEEPR